jgi:hypothetical protein
MNYTAYPTIKKYLIDPQLNKNDDLVAEEVFVEEPKDLISE